MIFDRAYRQAHARLNGDRPQAVGSTKVKSLSRGLEAEDRVYHLILCQSLWELQDIVDVMMGEDSM